MFSIISLTIIMLGAHDWCIGKVAKDDWKTYAGIIVACLIDICITGGLVWALK